MLHVVLLFVLLFCVVVPVLVALVVAGIQSLLLSLVLFFCVVVLVLVVAIVAGGVQSSSSSLSSFVVSSSTCHCPSLLVAITVYCCYHGVLLFRVVSRCCSCCSCPCGCCVHSIWFLSLVHNSFYILVLLLYFGARVLILIII